MNGYTDRCVLDSRKLCKNSSNKEDFSKKKSGMRDKGLIRKRPVQQKTKECNPNY